MENLPPNAFQPLELDTLDAENTVGQLLCQAAEMSASDMFILSNERSVNVAVRRMGVLEPMAELPVERGRQLISFVKVMAGMDISEHRRPMDGRWLCDTQGRKLDIRINTIATLFGEDMTLRIWDRDQELLELDDLGLSSRDIATVQGMLSHPSGLILVTGPTGTGKTTTQYACIHQLNDGTRKINTLEDPIEYAMPGVRQSQVHHKLGIEFPDLLQNVLRQSPDVIMIGEIRDEFTATTAVRAANSGHLVLATLHAPIAAGAVQSMLALGAQPYFFSGCLLGVIAQRLVRMLCDDCKVEYDISEARGTFDDVTTLLEPGEGNAIYGPAGCEKCFQAGYIGRTGIFEVMTMTHEIRHFVAEARTAEEIHALATKTGMVEFRRGALLKVAQGITSTEEILRAVPSEHLGLED